MALARLKLAKECKSDAACWGKVFSKTGGKDDTQHQMLKAAYELGRIDRAQALPVLLANLGKTDQLEIEQALLFSISRLAGKDCKECKEKVKELLEKNLKMPTQTAKVMAKRKKVELRRRKQTGQSPAVETG